MRVDKRSGRGEGVVVVVIPCDVCITKMGTVSSERVTFIRMFSFVLGVRHIRCQPRKVMDVGLHGWGTTPVHRPGASTRYTVTRGPCIFKSNLHYLQRCRGPLWRGQSRIFSSSFVSFFSACSCRYPVCALSYFFPSPPSFQPSVSPARQTIVTK